MSANLAKWRRRCPGLVDLAERYVRSRSVRERAHLRAQFTSEERVLWWPVSLETLIRLVRGVEIDEEAVEAKAEEAGL